MTSVGVGSWNANRIPGDKLAEMMDELVASLGRRIICLQEVRSLPEAPAVEGWLVFHGEGCAAAVAVPRELSNEIRWRHNSDLTSSVLIGELGVMSAYFADSGKSMEEFEKSILMATSELRKLRTAGAKYLM
eukprot:3211838-Karenia_brevis.AAC.1